MEKQILSFSTFVFSVLFLLLGPSVFGQVVNNIYPCPTGTQLPPACKGASYTMPFSLDMPLAGNPPSTIWSMIPAVPPGYTSSFSPTGELTINVPATAMESSLTFQVRASSSLNPGIFVTSSALTLQLILETDPFCATGPPVFKNCACRQDVVYVLDRSGSMNWGMNPADPISASNPSRWEKLKQVLDYQMSTLLTLGPASNRIFDASDHWSLIFFGHNGDFKKSGTFDDISEASTTTAATTAFGGTPLGGGLNLAYNHGGFPDLGATGVRANRLVLLITDGKQNVNPMVNISGASQDVSCGASPSTTTLVDSRSGVDVPIPAAEVCSMINLRSPTNSEVKIQSIGIGQVLGDAHDLLTNLGRYVNIPDASSFNAAMNTTIYQWLRGCSPRILDTRNNPSAGSQTEKRDTFYLNEKVQSLTVQFFAPNEPFSETNMIEVFKDGLPVQMNIEQKSHLRLLSMSFSDSTSSGMNAAGMWVFKMTDPSSVRYTATAIVEDKLLRHSLTLGNGDGKLYAGDPMPVKATLAHRASGVSKAKAVAILYRPGDDLGEIASAAPTPTQLTPTEQGSSLGQAKVDYVVSQKDYYDRLREENRLIDLTDNGNGEYTGTFVGNEVTGGYRVIVRFEGFHPEAKRYQGWEMQGIFFDFSRPEDIVLRREIIPVGTRIKGEPSRYIVRITPVNKFGNRIGPGQESRIRVNIAQGSTGDLKDNLDGSYEVPVVVPYGSNPDVTVYVADKQTPVSRAPLLPGALNPWSLSLHTGLTIPTAKLALYSPSAFVEADLTYRLSSRWDAEALLGYYGFRKGFSIFGASVLAGYRFDLQPSIYLRPAAGAGYFKPEGQSGTVGYTARLELAKSFNSRLDGTLHGAYFTLPDPNYTFWAAGIGIKYRL
jgi:hypothetical protein